MTSVLMLATTVTACGTAGTVTVMASWTGAEEEAFIAVLDEFTRQTGIEYDYHGTRALSTVLAADVQKGTPPDVAVLPSPNELASYARDGVLHPLPELADTLRNTYTRQWFELAQGDRPAHAVVVKATLKSLVWFNTAALPGAAPDTWEKLLALTALSTTPWCMGMGATSTSGFPGTDWIEDILLQRSGPGLYQRWATGELPWTAPDVRAAWQSWGQIALAPGAVHGGTGAALLTDFADANNTMFADPPGCFLEHQGSFVVSDYRSSGARPSTRGAGQAGAARYDFFPLPGGGDGRAWEVSADVAGMFRDTPLARALMRFLASDSAQRIWPQAQPGAVFSVNRAVSGAAPEPGVRGDIARILTSEATLCFDASDLMPATMTTAFNSAVLDYLAEPDRLDELLGELDRIRQGLATEAWAGVACGQ